MSYNDARTAVFHQRPARWTAIAPNAYRYGMVISGSFAATGLLLLALHLARPGLLRSVVQADTQMWWFLPWVTADTLDPDGLYQRAHRLAVVVGLVVLTAMNLALFAVPYADVLTSGFR